jgi:hypothetical protein
MNSTDKRTATPIAEILQASTPHCLAICAALISIAAILSNSTDSVKIAFAGAAATGLGAAAGLARSPDSKAGVKQISNAENVDVNL